MKKQIYKTKIVHFSVVLAMFFALTTHTIVQAIIYRCGNTYTNSTAGHANCKVMEGGNITVVETTPNGQNTYPVVNGANGSTSKTTKQHKKTSPSANRSVESNMSNTASADASPNTGQKVAPTEQRARDSDAKAILEAELRKAESKQNEILKEYNKGEPEKVGSEFKNPQKYLDRITELKANIARLDNDIAGIRRELGRTAGG